jgi:nitrogen-specific signal transduction histidine kinase
MKTLSWEVSEIRMKIKDLLSGTNSQVLGHLYLAIDDFKEAQFYQTELVVNGIKGIFTIRVFPVDDDGVAIDTILILEDITGYDDLQKSNMLTDKLSTIGLLAPGVAHEINNPWRSASTT